MRQACNPWMKFYPSDWRGDETLSVCSIGARGLWVEILCIMHKAEPYGHLVMRNGASPSIKQIALLTRISEEEVSVLLHELEEAAVFNRTHDGVIFSRRMVRDEQKRNEGKEAAEYGTLPYSRRGKAQNKKAIKAPIPEPSRIIEEVTASEPPSRIVERVATESPSMMVERVLVEEPPSHPEARNQKPEYQETLNSPELSERKGLCTLGDLIQNLQLEQSTNLPEELISAVEHPPEQPPPKAAHKEVAAKKGRRLSKEWQPNSDDQEYAKDRGFNSEQIKNLVEGFKDYWLANATKNALKLDWSRTWHTWVRNDIEYRGQPNQRQPQQHQKNGGNYVQYPFSQKTETVGSQTSRRMAFLAGMSATFDDRSTISH